MQISESLEEAILSPLLSIPYKRGHAISHQDLSTFLPHIQNFSKRYVERTTLHASISELQAKSYAAYYGIINAYKCLHLYSLLPKDFTPLSLLDFGAGSGTAAIAASIYFPDTISATHIEVSDGMNMVAKKITSPLVKSLTTLKKLDSLSVESSFNLIIAANSLNEVPFDQRTVLAQELISRCCDGGYIIFLEPGTMQASSELIKLREALLSSMSGASIFYPCFHQFPCKLLSDGNGWCHREIQLQRSPYIRQIDQALGFNKHTISFSALIFRKNGTHLDSKQYRVITEAKKNKVGSSAYLCGADYQGLVSLGKRDRNDENRGFEKLQMHDQTQWFTEYKRSN
jgi:ribosomal protein RSM22 (predicted rRNA methylase)